MPLNVTHHAAMKKRALIAVLWSYTGWYSGAIVAAVFGMSPWLGPIVALTALGVVLCGHERLRVT